MTVLVTGGVGYIGSHTVAVLHAAGHAVVVLDDFSNAPRDMAVRLRHATGTDLIIVEGDASDPRTVRQVVDEHGVSNIIHLAALKNVQESIADPLRYYRTNLDLTLAVASVAADTEVQRIVFSSSAAVYGRVATMPVSENDAVAPASPYGASKAMCERIFADVSAAGGVETVMLRYFNPVGAFGGNLLGDRSSSEWPSLVTAILEVASGRRENLLVFGDDYETRDGSPVRDFVHVMDVAEAHLRALTACLGPRSSRVFNLGTGTGTTVLEVLAAARDVTGRPIRCEITERRPGDVAASWADCRRARKELGWRARRDLRQMIRDHWEFQHSLDTG